MSDRWKITAVATLAFAVCLSAHAQSPDLPAAPTPSVPSPSAAAKPSFALPTSAPSLPPGPPPAKIKPFCFASADGLFSARNQLVPEDLVDVYKNYLAAIDSEIFDDWSHHLTIGEKNAWGKGRVLAVRFAIHPDGSFTTPAVTRSSGKDNYDDRALKVINSRGAFPPLPGDVQHAFPVCLVFGFNLHLESGESYDWLPSEPIVRP